MQVKKNTKDWLECERTARVVKQIDPFLLQWVKPQDLQLQLMAGQYIRHGGKKLRPCLLVLCASFGAFREKELLGVCAGLELLHIASLYHDDVMDRASFRRKQKTVNDQWGNNMAVHTGTYLFAEAIRLLASVAPYCNYISSEYVVDLCTGQLTEAENAYNLQLEEATYMDTIRKKTASLFELPCQLGAYLGKLSKKETTSFVRFGANLGLAFQIMDDVLDFKGQMEHTGKTIGTDIRMGVYSLPILYALENKVVKEDLKKMLLKNVIDEADIRKITDLVVQSSGLERAVQKAKDYCLEAGRNIQDVAGTTSKTSLQNLLEFTLHRLS